MKKKKRLLVFSITLLLGVLVGLVVLIFNPFKSDKDKTSSKIQAIGDVFYTEFFYPQQVLGLKEAEIAQKMTSIANSGIKISLEDMAKVSEIHDQVVSLYDEVTHQEANMVCNPSTTYVVITPKQPFSLKDYDQQIVLDCK